MFGHVRCIALRIFNKRYWLACLSLFLVLLFNEPSNAKSNDQYVEHLSSSESESLIFTSNKLVAQSIQHQNLLDIDWDAAASVATTVSVIIAAASLLSGFFIYYISKRDEKIKSFRTSLVSAKTISHQLDSLLNYEMGYECAISVVESRQLKYFLQIIYDNFFDHDNVAEGQADSIKDYLEKNTPSIMAPFHSSIADSFEEKLSILGQEASSVEFDFPGVARIIFSARNMLRNVYLGQKRLIHSEGSWKAAIQQAYDAKKQGSNNIRDFEALQLELVSMFVGTWLNSMSKSAQEDINDTLAALDLVVSRYLGKTPSQLIKISEYEKSQNIKPIEETETIAEDLLEAEKCLSKSLDQQDILSLRQYSSQMKARLKSSSK